VLGELAWGCRPRLVHKLGERGAEFPRATWSKAEALAIGLDLEVVPVAYAVAWAAKMRDKSGGGDVTLGRIAALDGCGEALVAYALRTLPGAADRGIAEVLLVRRLFDLWRVEPSHGWSMLCKLGLSYVIRELSPAADCYYGARSRADYYGTDRAAATSYGESMLVLACAHLVEDAESILDPVDGPPPPPWLVTSPRWKG
jgi:hypothetical protein